MEMVKVPWSISGMFSGRYAVSTGKRVLRIRWKQPAFEEIKAQQEHAPVPLLQDGRRTLWHFHSCFYWEDEGWGADDVKTLVLQRERRQQQKLQTAHSLMKAEEAGRKSDSL